MTADEQKEEITTVGNAFGRPPGWLVRYGIMVVFFFVGIMLLISYFISYPDTLQMSAIIHSETAPVDILSRQSGKIAQVYAVHNQKIDSGAMVMTIASTLDEHDLSRLKAELTAIEAVHKPDDLHRCTIDKGLSLGSISASHIELVTTFEELVHYLSLTETAEKIKSLREEMAQTTKLIQSLKNQEITYSEAMALSQKKIDRNTNLNHQGVIADADLEDVQTQMLQNRIQKENYVTGRVNYEVKIQQLQTQIHTLLYERQTAVSDRMFKLRQLVSKIRSEITAYEDLYAVRTPMAGTLSYTKYWSKNQWVIAGDTIGSVTPPYESGSMILEGYLPIPNSGKIAPGQTARVEIANYPVVEYGTLSARVTEISVLPSRHAYLVKLELTNGLTTTYKKIIPARQNMQAHVIVETEKYSLLGRLFMGIKNVFI